MDERQREELVGAVIEAIDKRETERRTAELERSRAWQAVGCVVVSLAGCCLLALIFAYGVVPIDDRLYSLPDAIGKFGLSEGPSDAMLASEFDIARAQFYSVVAGYTALAIAVFGFVWITIEAVRRQTGAEIKGNVGFWLSVACNVLSVVSFAVHPPVV